MSEEQVMETLRLRTAALHRVCASLDEWRDRAERAEAALGHVCDGDCQATAEWRQQQIRDLTQRAERAEAECRDRENSEADARACLADAENTLARVRELADEWAKIAGPLDKALPYPALRTLYEAADDLRAALGDAS